MPGQGPPLVVGNNCSVAVAPDSRREADRFMEALADGGHVVMHIAEPFWGSYFGLCTDRFEINRMINHGSV